MMYQKNHTRANLSVTYLFSHLKVCIQSCRLTMSNIYLQAMGKLDKLVPPKLQPLWSSPAGPKTVFFWAPAFKWCLVFAGLGDLKRPVEKLSVTQSSALAATGIIWSRYSMVITPKNYSLFAVNIFVAITGFIQLGRIYNYKQSLKLAEE
ncbi:hypothetical protein EB796_002572 [Bugula neritina]|uniref:Mitochondrial pyruvate carrier n=1 Tax=Bugula neritina TaxID=10212 RepID=A0A7J7KL79_BUGNE|nr:hypothetical protein EB796_002572 [Bugula neritina]